MHERYDKKGCFKDSIRVQIKLEKMKNLHVVPSQPQIKKKIKNKDIMIGLHDMQTNHIFLIFLQIKYECTLQVIRYNPNF